MSAVLQVIHGALWIFIALMWIRFVVDWVQIFARSWTPGGVLLVALEVVYSITDPPLRALRKVLKPVRVGAMSLDLAFIALFLLVSVLMQVNRVVFYQY